VPRRIARRPTELPPLRTGAVLALGVIVAVLLASDDGGGEREEPQRAPAAGPVSAKPASSFLERIVPLPATGLPGARVEGVIRRLVAGLPPERKAAQLMLIGFRGQDPSATFFRSLKRRDFGGVVFERRNYRDSVQLEAMTASVANATARRGHEPPLMLARQGGGDQSAFPDFPPAGEPGELAGLPDAVDQFGDTARALRAVGMSGVIGPAVDVAPNEAGALGARAFSDDPAEVADFAKAGVAAFRRAKLLSAVEHFPGIGGATQHTDEGPAQVGLSLEELRERDLVPFRAAIRAGAPAVVIGHGSYATDDFVLPATMSNTLATDVLRGGLGFRGIAISDDLAAGAFVTTQPSVPRAAVEAIRAGVDMVWLSGPPALQAKVYRTILAAIRKGTISRGRLDTALTRIITVKRELGLRVRKRIPPPQYPNAANPGSGQVEPAAPGVGAPPPPAPPAPPPVQPAPPAGAP
jgi:beta-N-acetylhexosaminidase